MSTPKTNGASSQRQHSKSMKEPYRSQFIRLIREGVATRDIHDSDGIGGYDARPLASSIASDAFVDRELSRVAMHSGNLCSTLVDHIGSSKRILDLGCGTGGTTVALARSALNAEELIGVDANKNVLGAAELRALGYDLPAKRVKFLHSPAGSPLDFPDGSFDLATCVSVLEFISAEQARRQFVAEILRVVKCGGHVFLATPGPFRLREHHSRRVFGDWRRSRGYPWSSPPWSIRTMFADCEMIPLARHRLRRHKTLRSLDWAAPALGWAFPWQQFLFRKR
jgi:SAM-dependent methyltransferase